MPTIPYRISAFTPWDANPDTGISPTTFGVTYVSGVLSASSMNVAAGHNDYYVQKFQLDGTPIGALSHQIPTALRFGSVRHLNSYWGTSDVGATWHWYNLIAGTIVQGTAIPTAPNYPGRLGANQSIYQNGKIYSADSNGVTTVINRYNAPGGTPSTLDIGVTADLGAPYVAGAILLGTSNTGDVYAMESPGGGIVQMWRFSASLSLIHHWTYADTVGTRLLNNASMWNFAVQNNMVVFNVTTSPIGSVYAVALVAINPVTNVLSDVGSLLAHANSPIIGLGGCLFLDRDGVFSVCTNQPIIWTSP